jgi:hypothetical protein
MASSLCKALKRAERASSGWEDLSHGAAWVQNMLVKNRMTEAQALEEILPAIPRDAPGQLIRASLRESRDLATELDDVMQAADEMASAMRHIAPWDRLTHEPRQTVG